MPFYKISISLKKSDQSVSGQTISVIRDYKEPDLDRVWHMLHVKCEEKWGRKLNSFDVPLYINSEEEVAETYKRLLEEVDNLGINEWLNARETEFENRHQ